MKYLDIKIYPSQSLSKKGLVIIMITFTLPAILIGAYFSLKGAWPVAGFFGLELLLIYFAFKICFYNNDIYEHILLDDEKFKIDFHDQKKLVKTISLEPTWIRVSLDHTKNNSEVLSISSHGNKNTIGKFLSPWEKKIIAEKITYSLYKRKTRN